MNWDAIGAIGEITGGIGVVVSLIFVGIQVRKNTIALKDANSERAVERTINFNHLIASDSTVAQIWFKGLRSSDQLDEIERVQFSSLAYSIFLDAMDQQKKIQRKTADAIIIEALEENMRYLVSRNGIWSWWSTTQLGFSQDFRDWVNGIASDVRSDA